MRECCRQAQAKILSTSRKKIHLAKVFTLNPVDRQESHAKTPCAFLIVNMNEQAGSIWDIRCGIGHSDDAVATRLHIFPPHWFFVTSVATSVLMSIVHHWCVGSKETPFIIRRIGSTDLRRPRPHRCMTLGLVLGCLSGLLTYLSFPVRLLTQRRSRRDGRMPDPHA